MSSLRELRKKCKLTQQFVASELNVSQQAVAKWENNESFPKTELLPKIANMFGCTIDDLFDKEGA